MVSHPYFIRRYLTYLKLIFTRCLQHFKDKNKQQDICMPRIAIIGAGVVGLSTALCIKLQHPSLGLTIIAERFLEDTTSDGAGGLFRPDDRFVLGVDRSILRY